MILAGDVGGTKVHLALYNFEGGRLNAVRDHKYPAHDFPCLDDVVNHFLSVDSGSGKLDRTEVKAACFGCPGPVRDGRIKLTNLPWALDVRELAKSLSIEHIFLINDLEANGYGIPELAPDKIFTLHDGDPSSVGHRGLIAAGTGLGEAMLIWDGKLRHIPIPSEGGHCDFAARNEIEIALLEYLRRTLAGRVSFERVVSGLGIKNVYAFCRDDRKMEEPAWLTERLANEDPNAVIGECGENGSSPICARDPPHLRLRLRCGGRQHRPQDSRNGRNLPWRRHRPEDPQDPPGRSPSSTPSSTRAAWLRSFKLSPSASSSTIPALSSARPLTAEARASENSGHSERAASLTTPDPS